MPKIIKLSEYQLKEIINNILLEERKRFFPPKMEMMPNHKEILEKLYETYGTNNPYIIYEKLKKYGEELKQMDAMPSMELEIAFVLGLLEQYYSVKEIVRPDRSNRPRRTEPELQKGVTYVNTEPTGRKFDDRFKVRFNDMKKV